VEDSNLKQIKLSFKVDDQIVSLLNNVNSFGKIIIETKTSDVDIEAYKQNQDACRSEACFLIFSMLTWV
jgi:hypothetical protein